MSEKEDLRMNHAIWIKREIKALLEQEAHVSKDDLEKLDNVALAHVAEKHPDFTLVEKIERMNLNYLYNLRVGYIAELLGKSTVNRTMEWVR